MSLWRALGAETMNHLASRPGARAVTLVMVSLAFVVFNTFLLVSWNLERLLHRELQAVRIEAFLSPDLSQTDGRNLADLISTMNGVRSVYYVSVSEAEALFRAEMPEQERLLDLLSGRFQLPASIQVSLKPDYDDEAGVRTLARAIRGLEGVTEAVYGEEYLPGLTRAVSAFRKLLLFLGTVLAVSIALVVAYTVRLSALRRSLTVEVMSIVGAPDWFIVAPFLVEGTVTGLLGALGGLTQSLLLSAILQGAVGHAFVPPGLSLTVVLLGGATGAVGAALGIRPGRHSGGSSK
jgi:cell division transport system permease protein